MAKKKRRSSKLCSATKPSGDETAGPYECKRDRGHTGLHHCYCCDTRWRTPKKKAKKS